MKIKRSAGSRFDSKPTPVPGPFTAPTVHQMKSIALDFTNLQPTRMSADLDGRRQTDAFALSSPRQSDYACGSSCLPETHSKPVRVVTQIWSVCLHGVVGWLSQVATAVVVDRGGERGWVSVGFEDQGEGEGNAVNAR